MTENPLEAIHIQQITQMYEAEARKLILKGLEERFGFIDATCNPDLESILHSYSQEKTIFLIGVYRGEVNCTGAITYETAEVGRVERVSVVRKYRRTGLAKKMMDSLETWAKRQDYRQLVLETNNDWYSAIKFYENRHYNLYLNDGSCSHFEKIL
ncbi:putative N-acetyltransferase [Planococcus sp. PAMC 21323]|uniref:GNAT family N-acetyltransferase n=1 Tax=Planococcus sp. PAMC 21323 TaxID=1526927 RepID=UPI000571C60D|nr:GNAT family N-acetyltransferase [Planococcus sp. PAMC 21323]AIY05671.1 putative N-acetyltransferase [Planococcus sp. PAMC 21323]